MQRSKIKEFRYSRNFTGIYTSEEAIISAWFSPRPADLVDPVRLSIEDEVFFEFPLEFFATACRRSFSLGGEICHFQIIGLKGCRYEMWDGPLKGHDITKYIVE